MKVFWVLAFSQYYPEPYLQNVRGCFETIEEAQVFHDEIASRWDYTDIVDVREMLGVEVPPAPGYY